MGIAVMVTSGKGGTGKTSLTAGIGSCLAALGHRVLCIDLDIGLRNLDIALGMDDRAVMDFTDVMEGRCALETAAAEHPGIGGLFLITAPLRLEYPDRPGFRRLVQEACARFDYVMMDAPAGLGTGFQLALAAADRALVVSAMDPAALRDAQRTVGELAGRLDTIHLVVNRVDPRLMRRLHTSIDDAMDVSGLPLLGLVPEDPQVVMAATRRMPLILYTHTRAAVACLSIAKRLAGQRIPLMRIR